MKLDSLNESNRKDSLFICGARITQSIDIIIFLFDYKIYMNLKVLN